MTGYYDLVLGLIPFSLVAVTATLSVAGVSLTSAVPLAASVSVALIGHALFVNSPVEDVQPPIEDTQSTRDASGFEAAD